MIHFQFKNSNFVRNYFFMKTHKLIVIFFFLLLSGTFAQKQKLYNPEADGKQQLAQALVLADSLEKQVFIQVGGNWCPWCLKFNRFCIENKTIDTLLQNNYVVVHLNFSTENKNLDVLKTLDYPQRFGFPVIVILDSKGKRIHTQDSALLEKEGSYDLAKVENFLKNWTINALNPENFK